MTVKVSYNSTTKKLSADIDTVQTETAIVQNKRIVFTNTLIPSAGSITLSAKKELIKAGETDASSDITDSDGNLKEFSFKLEQVDASGVAVTPAYSQTKQNTVNGAINFAAIKYESTDVDGSPYYYKISEVAATSDDGYKYSTDNYFVKVDLTLDNTTNRIVATPTYYKGRIVSANEVSASEVVFVNEEREAVLKLEANKVLVGAKLSDYYGEDHDGFEFTATRDGKTYKCYNDARGNIVIDINEVFGIADVVKTTTGISTAPYEYIIKETSKDGFTCDTKEYVAKVTFSFTSSGIEPTVKYYESTDLEHEISAVEFTNTKEDTQEITITALKTFGTNNDKPGANRIFSFGLYEGDSATPIQIKQNDADGNVTFDKIVYDQSVLGSADSKSYEYKVKEIVPSPRKLPGYTYDATEYTINVTLTRNSSTGKIDVTHTITKSGSTDTQSGTNIIGKDSSDVEFIQFNNSYDGTTKWPLSVRKVLSGNEDVNLPFTFVLEKYTDSNFTTKEATYEAKSDNTGYAVFDGEQTAISGTLNQVDNYYYILKEKNTGDALVSYSTEEIKLLVTADVDNKITVKNYVTDEVYEESRVTYTNTIKVKVKKTDISGNELSGAELQVKNGDSVVNTNGGNEKTNGITDNTYTGITVGQEYTLKEIKAPVGYALADDVKFKVVYNLTDEKYELQVDNGNGYETVSGTGDDAITVVMKDTTNSLIIN